MFLLSNFIIKIQIFLNTFLACISRGAGTQYLFSECPTFGNLNLNCEKNKQ